MRYLLDTHTFLWAYGQSDRLPEQVRTVIENPSTEVFVSAVTFWEIGIKLRAKRLNVGGKTAVDLIDEAQNMGFFIVHLGAEEAASQQNLTEDTHFDPFDRMLIWQAIQRDMILISKDPEFAKFKSDGLNLLWK
jgi:PIN domain nuclease of toxin-antitoxin system